MHISALFTYNKINIITLFTYSQLEVSSVLQISSSARLPNQVDRSLFDIMIRVYVTPSIENGNCKNPLKYFSV